MAVVATPRTEVAVVAVEDVEAMVEVDMVGDTVAVVDSEAVGMEVAVVDPVMDNRTVVQSTPAAKTRGFRGDEHPFSCVDHDTSKKFRVDFGSVSLVFSVKGVWCSSNCIMRSSLRWLYPMQGKHEYNRFEFCNP